MTMGAYFEVRLMRDDGTTILQMTGRASDGVYWSSHSTPIIFGHAGDNMALFGFKLVPDVARLELPYGKTPNE